MPKNKKIGDFLSAARLMIEGALGDQSIQEILNNYNYTPERLNTLRNLLEEAQALSAAQSAGYGAQHAASAQIDDLRSDADETYKVTRRLARLSLVKNADARRALLLDGIRPRSIASWLHQATVFYDNLLGNESFLESMEEFGYTREKLEAEKAKVEAVRQADTHQENSKGEAVAGTKERDTKLDELGEAMSKLKAVARIGLNHEQQTKLGLTGRTTSVRNGAHTEEVAEPATV